MVFQTVNNEALYAFAHRIGCSLLSNKSYEYQIEPLNSIRSTSHICHSEEHSDEESILYRRCEDPSLSLRMTWKEALLQHQCIMPSPFVILRNEVTKNLFLCRRREDPSLSLRMTWKEALLQHQCIMPSPFVILRNEVTKNLFLCRRREDPSLSLRMT